MRRISICAPSVVALAATLSAFGSCLDAASEPHHRVVVENNVARILELSLPRLESTKPYCYARPFLRIFITDTRASTGNTGTGLSSHDWQSGAARFTYVPVERTVRNETNEVHREIIVELRRTIDYLPRSSDSDTDGFSSDPGTTFPSWTVSFSRGGVTAQKTQLAPGQDKDVNSSEHLLIALDELDLSKKLDGNLSPIRLGKTDSTVLPGSVPFTLTNQSKTPTRFILVEF